MRSAWHWWRDGTRIHAGTFIGTCGGDGGGGNGRGGGGGRCGSGGSGGGGESGGWCVRDVPGFC